MKKGYLTDIEGIEVGHAENKEAMTGCTVILCKEGATGGIDVRGSGPGTRETDIFDSKKMIEKVHGIVLAGGSAFGLDASSGVMKYLEEEGVGFDSGGIMVPIVSSAVIYDLAIGDSKIRPDSEMGYEAAKNASKNECRQGNVGCGIGATVGKILGPKNSMKSGLGSATIELGELKVSAIVSVNSMGDIYDTKNNKQIAGVYDYKKNKLLNTIDIMKNSVLEELEPTNTTIGVIGTNAILTKSQANKIAEMAHNGYARAINPVHTMFDGDTIFTLGTNKIKADINLIGVLAAEVMEDAIINAIKKSESKCDLKSFKDIQGDIYE